MTEARVIRYVCRNMACQLRILILIQAPITTPTHRATQDDCSAREAARSASSSIHQPHDDALRAVIANYIYVPMIPDTLSHSFYPHSHIPPTFHFSPKGEIAITFSRHVCAYL